jgi:hypothetical protein
MRGQMAMKVWTRDSCLLEDIINRNQYFLIL